MRYLHDVFLVHMTMLTHSQGLANAEYDNI